MSNLRQPPDEKSARLPNWTEGTWITLADGQSWCFPPPASFPGYGLWSRQMAREIIERLHVLETIDPGENWRRVSGILYGNPPEGWKTLRNVLALYQTGYKAATELLKRNYDLTFADCERLLPFNYQVEDFSDPHSKLNTVSSTELLTFNAALAATGINIAQETDRLLTEFQAK